MNWKRLGKEVLIWIPTVLLVAMFLIAGLRKFPESGGWSQMFRAFGYPVWFRLLIGVVETAAALLLVVPRTAAYGAATMVVTMIGAIVTILSGRDSSLAAIAVPGICLVLALIVGAARWSRRWTFTHS